MFLLGTPPNLCFYWELLSLSRAIALKSDMGGSTLKRIAVMKVKA